MAVGYNPRPELPDPFALAVALGYSRPEQEGWDIGTAMDKAIATNPAHAEALRSAHVQRYGVGWDQPGGLGAEHATSVWPKVLSVLFGGGFPSYREVHDATFFGTKGMVVEAWQKSGVVGYSPDKPQRVVPGDPIWGNGLTGFPDPEPRLYMVPPSPEKGEPGWFKNYRDSVWGGTMYYSVEKRPGTPGTIELPVPIRPTTDPRDGEIADLRSRLNEAIAEAGTLRTERNTAIAWKAQITRSAQNVKNQFPARGGGVHVQNAKKLVAEILGE